MPAVQRPLAQSLLARHILPEAHFWHTPPPQSTSVSVPLRTPSLQVGAAHRPLMRLVPAGQTHMPAEHTAPDGHADPHLPQFVTSVRRSRHTPPQSVMPGPHVTTHWPLEHTDPGGQAMPHAPQFRLSEESVTHCPLQTVWPAGQLTEHLPFWQTEPDGQATPHAPQWLVLVCRSTHCPLQVT